MRPDFSQRHNVLRLSTPNTASATVDLTLAVAGRLSKLCAATAALMRDRDFFTACSMSAYGALSAHCIGISPYEVSISSLPD